MEKELTLLFRYLLFGWPEAEAELPVVVALFERINSISCSAVLCPATGDTKEDYEKQSKISLFLSFTSHTSGNIPALSSLGA